MRRPRAVELAVGALLATAIGGFSWASPAAAAESIRLSVTVMVDDGEDSCGTSSHVEVEEGTVVRWCYSVLNTGESTLTHHDLSSSVFGALLDGQVLTLVPGASTSVTATSTLTADTTDQATWTASNPQGGVSVSDSASATVTRFVANNPPRLGSSTHTTPMGQTLVVGAPGLLATAVDPDGDRVTVVAETVTTAHGTAEVRMDGSFTYRPTAGFVGTDRFTVTVTDGTQTASGTVTITVTAPPTTDPRPDPPTPGEPDPVPRPDPTPSPDPGSGPGAPPGDAPSAPPTVGDLPPTGTDPVRSGLGGFALIAIGAGLYVASRRLRGSALGS